MKLCGVVVWYNPGIQEVTNIKSYLNNIDKLFVVDNSVIDNKQLLQKLETNYKIEYTSNGENLGIARALNLGCQSAINQGYDWILTMDQDSEFEKMMVEKYKRNVEEMIEKDKSIAIFAPVINKKQMEKCEYVNKVITSGNILNLNAYEIVKGFDDELFIDEVDHDLCFNLLNKGYKIYQFSDIKLKHKLGDSKKISVLNKTFTAMNHNYIRKYYIVRNRLVVKNRYPQYTAGYLKSNIIDLCKVILGEDDKQRKIKYMLKGYIDYKKNKLGKIDI